MKIDIMKAFNSVSWQLILDILEGFQLALLVLKFSCLLMAILRAIRLSDFTKF